MFKCYRQLEHSDCGLTCIRMIARYYGKDLPLRYLHEITDLSRIGMSIKDIISCCELVGIDSVAINVSPDHIVNMPLPAILYWKESHFVVLYHYSKRKKIFYVADPAQGKIKYSEKDFLEYWVQKDQKKGLAILVEPNEKFSHQKFPKGNSFRNFLKYLKNFIHLYKSRFLYVLCISIVIMAADLSVPLLLRRTIDEGIGLKDLNLLIILLLTQLAVFIGSFISSNSMNFVLMKTGLKVYTDMVNTFLEKLARFPLSYFDRKVSSDFVKKIGDHHRIKDFLLSFPHSFFIMILTILIFSVLLAHYSFIIFIFFILASLIEILWNTQFLNKRKTLDYAQFSNASENSNHAFELTNGMADLKVNNAELNRIIKWKKTQKRLNDISKNSAKVNIIQEGGHSIISRVKELTVTGIGASMVISGDLTIGTLMTLGYITGRLSRPFSTFSESLKSFQDAYLSYQRIDDVINNNIEVRGNQTYSKPTITLESVYFKYAGSSSPYVIKNLSLDVEKGKVIAIVGESGCGKSTLIKLMLGFYIPQQGILKLSGNLVNDVNNEDWLKHCGVVMQEAKIFSGTILENIALSEDIPDIEKATLFIETVGLTDFVKSLPMGIHTRIGVSGIEMSGGQKQRLMIARAMYKNPDILFLDEATSSLDANNEKSLVTNISKFCKDKTIVIAAHRLSTVQNADKIVYLQDGRIEELGTHQELLSIKGKYWQLVKNQLQLSV